MPRPCRHGNHGWRGLGCGFRMTAPREAIYKTLASKPGHLSADEIFLHVRDNMPGIGLATVYRNLELLRSGGHIKSIDVGDGKSRYELNHKAGGPDHHHHLICRQCGQVINYMDFEDDELTLVHKLEQHLAMKYKYQVTDHDMSFYGTCPGCQKRTPDDSRTDTK